MQQSLSCLAANPDISTPACLLRQAVRKQCSLLGLLTCLAAAHTLAADLWSTQQQPHRAGLTVPSGSSSWHS